MDSGEIILPFNLRTSLPEFLWSESQATNRHFSNRAKVEFDDMTLTFRVQVLRPKPWPERVAGVPCY